ncbi:MAG: hypothetical protein E6H05_01945 [Bacillati bacterium ANGP1]|uniref:MarR family transcriptional regulator n=1 Tax=Candidatus Segetimicrobium genomatis TaxID=2569760 RepID=A0A537J0F2_9BACT|nr:MAG: hypothetical protein E6H05_01945 [Terrabacteria group bacterium ANGP1]
MRGLQKHDLLSYLAHTDEADANGVARAFGVHYSVAAMGLLRLVRQGLATRERAGEQGVYRYRLSERGQSRLTYFQKRSKARSETGLIENIEPPEMKH